MIRLLARSRGILRKIRPVVHGVGCERKAHALEALEA